MSDKMVTLIKWAIDNQFLRAVKYFTDNDEIRMADFNEILEYAQKKKTMEIVALLLEYHSRHDEEDIFDKYQI